MLEHALFLVCRACLTLPAFVAAAAGAAAESVLDWLDAWETRIDRRRPQ